MVRHFLFCIGIPGMAAIAIPIGACLVISHRSAPTQMLYSAPSIFESSRLILDKQIIGPQPFDRPRITHVQILDFDRDHLPDVIACDAQRGSVLWYRQIFGGGWEENIIATDIPVPVHATVVDLDQDGDRDVIVAVLGDIWPDDSAIGSVILLDNQDGRFVPRTLLDDVRRVTDVQCGDLDGDGDLDLVVAVFGYAHGKIVWLENRGQGKFRDHELLATAGTIHVPLADYDADGDLDIAAVVSQDAEEVWGIENLGAREFRARRLFFSINLDIGSAGLVQTDLDSDGDPDLLLPVGDNFENLTSFPQPYHGCLWLENQGDWNFQVTRIATFGGTYAAAAGDLDGDADQDVVLVSMFNEWDAPGSASIVWLENDGQQRFRTWQIDDKPSHLVTVACGDLNVDGCDDIVVGGLHLPRPFDRLGRITSWTSQEEL